MNLISVYDVLSLSCIYLFPVYRHHSCTHCTIWILNKDILTIDCYPKSATTCINRLYYHKFQTVHDDVGCRLYVWDGRPDQLVKHRVATGKVKSNHNIFICFYTKVDYK